MHAGTPLNTVAHRRLLDQESPMANLSNGFGNVQWGCDHQCASLLNEAADRCAVWHQLVVGFQYAEGPFNLSCVKFVTTKDVCDRKMWEGIPINITCNAEGRVRAMDSSRSTRFQRVPTTDGNGPLVAVEGKGPAAAEGKGPPAAEGKGPPAAGGKARRLVAAVGVMDQLQRLKLNNLGIVGTIPREWSRLSKLDTLIMDKNLLTGPLPEWFPLLTGLRMVDLSWNRFNGTIPAAWSSMTNLERLFLSYNRLEGPLPHEWGNLPRLNLLTVKANNLSSGIPQQWAAMESMAWLDVSVNPGIGGPIPPGLMKVKGYTSLDDRDMAKLSSLFRGITVRRRSQILVFIANGTNIRLPPAIHLHKVCQECQKDGGVLYIYDANSESFWCGKTWRPYVQVAVLWGCFAMAMLAVTVIRLKQQARKGLVDVGYKDDAPLPRCIPPVIIRSASQLQGFWTRRLQTPVHLALIIYDLISDVLLALSMYPSWTFYLVLVGLSLPDLICSGALLANVMPSLRRTSPALVLVPLSIVVYLATAATLPAVMVTFAIVSILKRGSLALFKSRLGELNLERTLVLMAGVTVCTEDIFTAIFSSVGLILMSSNPLDMTVTRIYFPVWAFWISVPASLLHMAIAWWQAWGNYIEVGNLSWVKEAFMGLYLENASEGDLGIKGVKTQAERGANKEGGQAV